jgi:chlorobactene glucosyltransferase
MTTFVYQHQVGIVVFLGILLVIALSNLRALRRLGGYPPPPRFPRVSILVPARNEEDNIAACVGSLTIQDYPDYEIVVLDDDSHDDTWRLLSELATQSSRLRILKGEPLPAGWLGKHWACHQLYLAATGELLLFTDADTRHHPHATCQAVSALLDEKADLLTVLVRQEVVSWAERLLVPIIPWSIFNFVPLSLAYRLRWPVLSANVGQFMLFHREAYKAIGGHEAVRRHVVDDLALGRRAVAFGLRWRLLDGSEQIRCRMYRNYQEVREGFSKNLFGAFDYNVPIFVLIWSWLLFVFVEPPLVLVLGITGVSVVGFFSVGLAARAVGASLVLWGLTCWRFGFPLYLVFFYPITILLTTSIAVRSLLFTLTGRATWKGRTLTRQSLP